VFVSLLESGVPLPEAKQRVGVDLTEHGSEVDIGVLRTAKRMKAKGLNTALIAEITGLSEKEIEELDTCG